MAIQQAQRRCKLEAATQHIRPEDMRGLMLISSDLDRIADCVVACR
jgi:hypothetical protein